ncbi:MAG TPA: hypothetical protein VNT02_13155, partial [Burkholderiales bacterium]|nr:hypothetical protein [Burkholderiales bacterium]
VSMLIHILALLELRPVVHRPSPEAALVGEGHGPLAVRILPPPSARTPPPAPAAEPRVQRAPAPRQRPAKPAVAPPKRTSPPVIALDKAAPEAPPAPTPAKPQARAPAEQDLSSYIEARRRARTDPAPSLAFPDARPQAAPTEDASSRANRLAAANLATGSARAFGYDPNRGGGIFSIQHIAYDYAEFVFYGWNREARHNTAQLIEVRKGANPDIRLAVVRKMIAIIREHEQNDFLWESRRLGRYVTLSARPRDNDGLEEFMLAEFFDEQRRVR